MAKLATSSINVNTLIEKNFEMRKLSYVNPFFPQSQSARIFWWSHISVAELINQKWPLSVVEMPKDPYLLSNFERIKLYTGELA